MSRSDIHLVDNSQEIERQFRSVMRRLAGGVSIVTAGHDDNIAGTTVTSLTSLSADPPRLLVSVHTHAPAYGLIARDRLFGINILASDQQELAARFSNGTLTGRQRFEGVPWFAGASGMPLLTTSVAAIECRVEEIIQRYSQAIIVGRLLSMDMTHRLSGLVYWDGRFVEIDHDADLVRLAEVGIPLMHVR